MAEFSIPLILPVLILVAWALLILLFHSAFEREQTGLLDRLLSPWTWSLLGTGFAAWACLKQWAITVVEPQTTAYGMVRVDRFGIYMSLLVLAAGFLTLVFSSRFLSREGAEEPEFYAMALLALAGMVLMLETTNLMMILIGLETFSLTLYVLCGLTRGRVRAIEAALKYFLLGAFSSGFLVYGLALTYGSTGTLSLSQMSADRTSPMLAIALGLVVVGFAFKIAAVPFHQWVPDVYTGAPTNVTGFMAAATKAVAFAALLRVLVGAFGAKAALWVPLVTWLAIVTMTVANLVALAQTNIKRLLAFSSIAHAGYLLIAVVCLPALGIRAILFYLTTYAFMTIGAFAVAAAVGGGDERGESGYDFISSWAGLGRRHPWLALAMTVFLLSMAGIPPTGGFFGKYLIFQAAVESRAWLLVIVGSLNAVVAVYYYLGVIMTMWFKEPDGEVATAGPVPPSFAAVLTIAAAVVLWLGLAPSFLLDLASGLWTTLT
ncbi:MAG TPA: NADH-quinone oxidoreductase subunit N [Candidatus Polarisedimenticolaceae bacterium]|nr:NADH-quinone oxidoreductase subunit N [Candidatus Polarisedimenticolaceae bacterium]